MTDKKQRANPIDLETRIKLIDFVRSADPAKPDADVAREASAALGRPIQSATVRDYRVAAGMKSVASPRLAELHAELRRLRAKLAEHGISAD